MLTKEEIRRILGELSWETVEEVGRQRRVQTLTHGYSEEWGALQAKLSIMLEAAAK